MNFEYRAGTAVTRKILDNLSSPDDKLKIIHIAGTNGKGSTAEFFTQILIAAGKRTGTFTSPQVYSYYDQFRVGGEPLPPEVFEKYLTAARAAAAGLNATDFETETACALYAFYREGCEYAVVECGMGGLDDATNAVNKKELAVITSVSLEHTAYLGDTVEKICAQKAGIIKNCPAIVNAHQTEEAAKYFESRGIGLCKCSAAGLRLGADGVLQPYNAATAIAGARLLGIPESAVYKGLENAKPRGRLEKFNARGREYILDGAHNPAAFEPLAGLLKSYRAEEVTVIFGCLSDKDICGNLRNIKGLAQEIIATVCDSPRARTLDETVAACGKFFENVSSAVSVSGALEKAKTRVVAVCGSFTLLKEAKNWIEKGR